ncbi:FtsX-like permease family protein [Streptomyces sp. NPDC058579]|uniref:ABC transporter permease n=1 Tax=Streptomyces sp. NPDC058579 TaxID=3346548 RepID=UPI00364CFD9A
MRAILRWAHSDLRAHRGEALFVVLASAGVIASLLLSGALLSYAVNPWQRVFNQSEGAHIWLHTRGDLDASSVASLASLDEVAGVSGPFRTTEATVEVAGARARVVLRGTGPQPPTVARPLITEGGWLESAPTGGGPGEIVLESALARALWADPGETVTVTGANGAPLALRVAGIAESAEPLYRTGQGAGVAWVLPGSLDRVASTGTGTGMATGQVASAGTGQSVGLRLKDPDDTDYVVQRAVTLLGAHRVDRVTNWQEAKADVGGDDRMLGQMFAAFGLAALFAAAVAISGAVRARVRGQLKDIAVLKAIGFTPGQVTRGFLVQHLGFAVLGAGLGTVATLTLGRWIPGRIGEAVVLWPELPGHRAIVAGLPVAAVLLIGTATGLAAWRAGRVPPVPAARSALLTAAPLTRLGRRAIALRLSPALVLGWRSAFSGRGRSLVPISRLALPVALMTVALVAWSTLDQFGSDPARMGRAAALTVRAEEPGPADDPALARALASVPGVEDSFPGAEFVALVPGQTGTITLRGLGSQARPYPHSVVEGRAPTGPDEAVAGQGLLDLLGVGVGEWVRMTVEGRPQILHVVGRSVEPEQGGRVISTSLDSLRNGDPAMKARFHSLVLRPGADPREVAAAVSGAVDGALEIRETPTPADRLDTPRGVIAALIAVLGFIALVELLTLISSGVRARVRDLLAMKAIGLTPRQIGAVIVTAAALTTLVAALLGTVAGAALGRWLVDAEGRSSGIGSGIAHVPSPLVLATLVAAATAVGAAAALAPAVKTARRRLIDSASETL